MKKGKAAPEKGRLVTVTRLDKGVNPRGLILSLPILYLMIFGGSSFYLIGVIALLVLYSLAAFRYNTYSTYIRNQTIIVDYGPLPLLFERPRPIDIDDVKQIRAHRTSGGRYSPSYTVQVKLKNGKTKILLFLPSYEKAQEAATKLDDAWREEMAKLHFERKAGYALNQVAENQMVSCARCGSAALLCRDCATEVRSV